MTDTPIMRRSSKPIGFSGDGKKKKGEPGRGYFP